MKKSLLSIGLLGFATTSLAHTGHGAHGADQLLAAFTHPMTGLDHLAVLLAMGFFIAGQAQHRTAKVLGMIALLGVGMVLGQQGLYAPMVETAIACSVIVLGVLSFKRWMPAQPILLGLMGTAAVLHGLAHGVLLQSLSLSQAGATGLMMMLGALMVTLLGFSLANNALVKRIAIQQWLAAAMVVLGTSLVFTA